MQISIYLQSSDINAPNPKTCFSCRVAIVFAQSIEVENEDIVGASPVGAAPTTSEWSHNFITY